jgi:predicted permease
LDAGQLAQALLPVVVLIGLGLLLARGGFLAREGWVAIERVVYFVLFPALLFLELAKAQLDGQPVLAMGGCLFLTQLALAAMAEGLRRLLRVAGPAHSSVVQCVVRFNSYVAIALAPALFGAAAASLTALAIAVMVPTANFLSVAALARHGEGAAGRRGLHGFLKALATNPLILACLAGLLAQLLGLRLPPLIIEPLAMLAHATLALGLLAVGAGLRLGVVLARPALVLIATLGQLVLKPLLAFGLARLLGVGGTALAVVILVSAVPTSTSSYILARLMGGDAELMAALITTTTFLALATLPLVLILLG